MLLLLACADPVPVECTSMCSAAADLYGGYLEDWGVGWPEAGYSDRQDFLDRCEVWAWEMRLLEEDAGVSGHLEQVCIEREELLSSPEAICSDYTNIDWSEVPW